jgi:WD40 repeat protein
VAITRWGSGAWRALDQGLGDKLYVLAFSPDGRWLAAGSSQLRVYALDSLEVVFERPSKETKGVVFTREADRLLAASGSMLEVIDAQRWTVIATFVDNIRGINALAYCPITESLFAPDVSRDIRHFRAVAAPMFEAVR